MRAPLLLTVTALLLVAATPPRPATVEELRDPDGAIAISPPVASVVVNPGGGALVALQLANGGDHDVPVTLTAHAVELDQAGAPVVTSGVEGPARWLTFAEDELVLQAGTVTSLAAAVDVPASVSLPALVAVRAATAPLGSDSPGGAGDGAWEGEAEDDGGADGADPAEEVGGADGPGDDPAGAGGDSEDAGGAYGAGSADGVGNADGAGSADGAGVAEGPAAEVVVTALIALDAPSARPALRARAELRRTGSETSLVSRLDNTGDAAAIASLRVAVRSWTGRTLLDETTAPLLVAAGESRMVTLSFRTPTLPGPYTAEIVAVVGDDAVRDTTSTLLWSPPAVLGAVAFVLVLMAGWLWWHYRTDRSARRLGDG